MIVNPASRQASRLVRWYSRPIRLFSKASPTVWHPSRATTVAMMMGSSSMEPAGRPKTHSPSILSDAAIVSDRNILRKVLDIPAQRDAIL